MQFIVDRCKHDLTIWLNKAASRCQNITGTFFSPPVWSRCLRDFPYRGHVLVRARLKVVHDALAAGADPERERDHVVVRAARVHRARPPVHRGQDHDGQQRLRCEQQRVLGVVSMQRVYIHEKIHSEISTNDEEVDKKSAFLSVYILSTIYCRFSLPWLTIVRYGFAMLYIFSTVL